MAEFLKLASKEREESLRDIFKTADTVQLTARCWNIVINKYFLGFDVGFLVCPLQNQAITVPERRFPMVEYDCFSADTQTKGQRTRVFLVEAMDPSDPGFTWEAEKTDVYTILSKLDAAHPKRKSFGALSMGSNFVLFEVTGENRPVYLVGRPESPAHFLNDASLLDKNIRDIRQFAMLGNCKYSDTEVTSGVAASVGKNATAKSAAPHIAKSTSSTSSATASPAITAKAAPAASVTKPIGHTAGTMPTTPVAGAKPTAASISRSSSPARAGGNGTKAISANK